MQKTSQPGQIRFVADQLGEHGVVTGGQYRLLQFFQPGFKRKEHFQVTLHDEATQTRRHRTGSAKQLGSAVEQFVGEPFDTRRFARVARHQEVFADKNGQLDGCTVDTVGVGREPFEQ